jgi:large subunit ribosomal protein L30e
MAEETRDLFEEMYGQEKKTEKKKKTKKVVRRRKTKKEKEKPLTAAIRLAVESGKVEFGSRKGIKNNLLGKAKLFVVAENTPSTIKESMVHYSEVSGIRLIQFEGTSLELGSVCGRPFPVSVLSVYDAGTSHILDLK